MKRKTWILLLFCTFFILFHAKSQTGERKNVCFPDIPGYITLKCDFHSHTIFSDGWVTPEYRVREAWIDGLDVIAITDHLDSKGRVKCSEQEKKPYYEKAFTAAKELGIVLVPGTELTRSMQIGHYNLLFLPEFGSVKEGPYINVLKKAKKQDAFIILNHPGWKQKDLIPIWYDSQKKVYKKKLMDGLEIANEHEYYPLAFTWAQEKNLTIMGNSDIHDSTCVRFSPAKGAHRPMTLVFSKDRSLPSIKEALVHRRTVVFYGDTLYGEDKNLLSLYHTSIEIPNKHIAIYRSDPGKESASVAIRNKSSFTFILKLAEKVSGLDLPDIIVLKGLSETNMNIQVTPGAEGGDKDYFCKYTIVNLRKGPGGCPVVDIPLHIGIF